MSLMDQSLVDQINNLEQLLTGSKVPGSNRSLVSLEKARQAFEELRSNVPEMFKEAESIKQQRDAIVKQAEDEAQRIREFADQEANTIRNMAEEQSTRKIVGAREEANTLVDDTSVVSEANKKSDEIVAAAEQRAQRELTQAREKSNQIISTAQAEAEQRRGGADKYAREVLFDLEERVVTVLGQVRSGLDMLDGRNASTG